MIGATPANPSLLFGARLALSPGLATWNAKAKELRSRRLVAKQMENTAKLLGDIVLPDWILGYLRCPHSGEKLLQASQAVLDAVAERARNGTLFTVLGRTISQVPMQGLVSANGRWFYVVNDEIAVLLADEAIDLDAMET